MCSDIARMSTMEFSEYFVVVVLSMVQSLLGCFVPCRMVFPCRNMYIFCLTSSYLHPALQSYHIDRRDPVVRSLN